MKKVRLITASFGDDPFELSIKSPIVYKNCIIDQIFYNNNNTKSREHSLQPRLKGKIPKMMEWLFYPDYDYYLWIDSKFILLEGFIEYILQYIHEEDNDLYIFKHPERDSMKAEMDFMAEKMRDGDNYLLTRYDGEIMEEQVNNYLADENFVDDKLFYCGLFLYSKNLVKNKEYNVMTDWFLNCVLYHTQDQLWFPYLIHKHGVKYKTYFDDYSNSSFLGHT